MKNKRLPKLRATPAENDRLNEFFRFVNIDKQSGIGYLTPECPQPWYTNYTVNQNWNKYKRTENIVKTPFVYGLRNLNPVYYYSRIVWNANKNIPCILSLNMDVDNFIYINKKKIKTSPDIFKDHSEQFVNAIVPKAYTRTSTNGYGLHNHFMLGLYRDDFLHEDGTNYTEEETSKLVREKILLFQSLLRQYCTMKDWKIHIDILGIPCIYDEDGYIFSSKDKGGRGNWNKMPNNLMDESEWQEFQEQDVWTWKELLDKIEYLQNAVSGKVIQKTKKQVLSGSGIAVVDFSDIDALVKRLDRDIFSGERMDIGDRHYATAEKIACCIKILKACAEHQKKKTGVYKGTVPMVFVESVHDNLYKEGLVNFKFNGSIYRWVKKKLYELNILIVPQDTEPGYYEVGQYDAKGEYKPGIAQKFDISQDGLTAYLSPLSPGILLPQKTKEWKSHNQFSGFNFKLIFPEEEVLAENYILYEEYLSFSG